MPHELVVSNVDIAAAICDVASVTPPSDYVLDGHSYVQDASESDNRVFNSCSIINGVPVHLPREPQLGGGQERGVFEYAHFTTKSSCTTSPQTRIRAVNLSVMCAIYCT